MVNSRMLQVDIGGDIEMKCTIQYASDYPVIWMKLDSVDR